MNTACQICRGACCESIVVPIPSDDGGIWLRYHATQIGPGLFELATPCKKLCEGRCTIHDTRPMNCRTYEVGGVDCRSTVLRRRHDQHKEIFAAMRLDSLTPALCASSQGKDSQ